MNKTKASNHVAVNETEIGDPLAVFLSDPESHLSDILYIYFRLYKKRLIHPLFRSCLVAQSVDGEVHVVDVGSHMGHDLLYIVRMMMRSEEREMVRNLSLTFLEGDPAARAAGVRLWEGESVPCKYEFQDAELSDGLPPLAPPPQIVICSEVVEHLEDPRNLIQQIHNALAPGGFLILTTDNSPSGLQWLRRIPRWLRGDYQSYYAPVDKEKEIVTTYERDGRTRRIYGHISLKPTYEWERIAGEAGFRVIEYGSYESIRRGGGGEHPAALAMYFAAGFLNWCLPRRIGRFFGDSTALLLQKAQ